jgi:hypothetical protein
MINNQNTDTVPRTSGMGSAYGFGGIGKIIGPIGLALIVGSSNIVKPDVTIAAIVPCFLYPAPGRRLLALPMRSSALRQRGDLSRKSTKGSWPAAKNR